MPRDSNLTALAEAQREVLKAKALECFAAGHTIISTAQQLGIRRETLYAWRTQFPDFGRKWDEAFQRRIDHLEDIGFDRAAAGSDTLLMFLLRGGRSERYGDKRSLDIKQHTDVDVRLLRSLPVEELLERLNALREAQRGLEIEGNVIDLDETRQLTEKPK